MTVSIISLGEKRFLKIFGNRTNLDETERLLKTVFLTWMWHAAVLMIKCGCLLPMRAKRMSALVLTKKLKIYHTAF